VKGWTFEHIEAISKHKADNGNLLKISKKDRFISKDADKNPKVTISANVLTKHTIRILDLKGFHVWRQNNGAVYDAKFNGYRKGSSTPGISDVIGFHKRTGQFIACEIKAGKDTVSDDQQLFIDKVNRSGGIGMVVKCIEDLEKFFKKWQSNTD
jgi:VRR-NUC domain